MGNTLHGRVTKVAVDKLEVGQTLRDPDLKGFGVRRQQGPPSYFLQKKVRGQVRWFTIGTHGSPWTPEKARNEASRLLYAVASGHDPQKERKERERNRLLSEISETFLLERGPKLKPRTHEEYTRLFTKFINPKFGRRSLADISRADVSKFHAGMSATRSQANFALTALSSLYTWAEERGFMPAQSNPCRGISRYSHASHERFLSPEELARLGEVLNELETEQSAHLYALAAIRLLLLTGARRNEILTLRWQYVDLGRRRLLLPELQDREKDCPSQ